jgi:SAM-dependent methyltransferase
MAEKDNIDLYGNAYGHFATTVLEQVRLETYGEDIGQSGWMTASEYRWFSELLELDTASRVVDICSGSGGPAIFMAQTTGCHVLGLDINENGIVNAAKLAKSKGLETQVKFQNADASERLPLEDDSVDAIVCIDAIIHLPNRTAILNEWHRVLKSGGRILYTDPTIITGLISKEEIAIRSSIGYFQFAPPGEDERLIAEAGFELIAANDVTDNAVKVSKSWHDARAKREQDLSSIEGAETFAGLQRFLIAVYELTSERRLSRFVFVARKN